MIIERITIENWRGYRGSHTFQFEEGINLLAGRNEAGKSTLFEALTRVLFDRHTSRTQEIRDIQPVASSLGPEAEIHFRENGRRYKAVKRFLQDPRSALYSERGGDWELDHEGDAADAQLREILSGEATTRTAARPEHRGLAQALWYLQSDGAIPEKSWSDGVKDGLQGLVQLAARSPVEADVLERIADSYDEHWTQTGRVKSNSELGQLQKELPELEDRLATLLKRAESIESYRRDLEEFRSAGAEKRTELERAQAGLVESSAAVQAAETHEAELAEKKGAKVEAVRKAERLRNDLSQIEGKQKKIHERRAEVEKLEADLWEATADVKAEAVAADRHARRWKEELEPDLKQLESELQALRSLERLRKLEKDLQRLEQHLQRISKAQEELAARREERAELAAPDDKVWKRFRNATGKLSVLEAQVEASAIRVAFEWSGTERKVETSPEVPASADAEYLVTEPTEFLIEDLGKVRVRSDAADLKTLLHDRDAVREQIRQVLTRYGASDAESLAAQHEKGRDLDQMISRLEKSLAEIEAIEPDAAAEFDRTKRGIEEEARGASDLPPEIRERGGQWIRDQIAAQESKRTHLKREIAEEQNAEKAALGKRLELVEARETASNTLAERRAEIHTHEEGITAILQTYGTVDQLRKLVGESDEAVQISTEALQVLLADYEEKVKTPKRLHEQARDRVQELEKQLVGIGTKVAEMLGRIEESAAQGNYSQLADTEIEVEEKRRRGEVLQRRAEGAKLLYDLVRAREIQRSAALSGPIQDLVNRWLRLLTEENYDALKIDHDLKPTGVHMARYNEELPLTSLSHGAQEQVVVLLRLGIAVLVSKDERNLVVIDDRLVNADSVRMKRLCLILQEAADTCQVVIATCNDTPYAGLGAHLVRVPADGGAPGGER